jgi:16S rRNA processing protein RimM
VRLLLAELRTPPEVAVSAVVVVGRFGAPHGVKGWLSVVSYTQPLDNIVSYRPWLVEQHGQWREVRVIRVRPHGHRFLAEIDGVADRDAAQRLVGCQIGVPESALPAVAEGEYYWKDLIGLDVVNEQGIRIGRVAELFETPANDVIVVRDAGNEMLIPFVQSVVKRVDIAGRQICVDWQHDG